MKRISVVAPLLILALVSFSSCGGGGGGGGGSNTGGGTTGATSATGLASTTTGNTIRTTSGAAINVPIGAVPQTQTGGTGSITFSIDKDTSSVPPLPAGVTQASDVYSFGPTATVFAQPVLVTLPLSQNYAALQGQLTIYRINPTSGVSELLGGTYDASSNTVSAQVYQFSSPSLGKPHPGRTAPSSPSSSMFVGFGPTSPYDYGCLYPVNSDVTNFRSVTTQSYTLSYPNIDTNFTGATSTWGISCLDGWCPQGNWFLPQGQYTMCVQQTDKNTLVTTHSDPIPATISQPFHASSNITNIADSICPNTFPLGAGSLPNAGPCPTTPVATTTVGTGALQITLNWFSASAVDLDLHVIDPNNEEIYWAHTTSVSGGTLDRDNNCGNYVNGRPENVYWTTPPAGQYKILVEWFDSCGSGVSSMPFEVRVINKGAVSTYDGTSDGGGNSIVTAATITVN